MSAAGGGEAGLEVTKALATAVDRSKWQFDCGSYRCGWQLRRW